MMPKNTILIVDDDETFLQVMARSFRRKGYEAITANSVELARTLLHRHNPQMAVVDLKMQGGESGLRLLPELKAFSGDLTIVVLTGYASIATAVEAIRLGARDYLCKPVDTDQILLALNGQPEPAVVPEIPMSVNRVEWEYIQKVLQEHQGNISATARSLGMHRRTLQRKLAKHPAARKPRIE